MHVLKVATIVCPVLLSLAASAQETSSGIPAATTSTSDPWAESGCSMAPGTALMLCLGEYASVPPTAPTGSSEQAQAAYYCDIYSQLANCWAAGMYCREWLPMRIAADKFCLLANVSSAVITPSSTTTVPAQVLASSASGASAINTLSSVIAEASNVITSIWNNDSGTDVPVIVNDLASETIATWTHMSTSSPLPATEPPSLATTQSTVTSMLSATTMPALRRVVRLVQY